MSQTCCQLFSIINKILAINKRKQVALSFLLIIDKMSCPLHTPTYSCPNYVDIAFGQSYITLLSTLMAAKCKTSDWCVYPDDKTYTLQDNMEFDYIVVGAGSSGSVVANRLSENPENKVLVLEAGGYPTSTSEIPSLLISTLLTGIDWGYRTEPSEKNCLAFDDGRCVWSRGKCLGGSSALNAMLYIRGHKKDYDEWAEAGNDGWDYESIFDYFLKSENLKAEELADSVQYGREGDQVIGLYNGQKNFTDIVKSAVEELGYEILKEEGGLGFFNALQTIDRGVRANAGKSFLGKHRDRENLIVSLRSYVEKIIIDDRVAKGVIATINGLKMKFRAKKEVIISAGAINSPAILIHSGIGPKEHLDKFGIPVIADLQVGKNLQDHLINFGMLIAVDPNIVEASDPVQDMTQYFSDGSGALGTTGFANFLGFINTRNDSDRPNIQYHPNLFPQDDTMQAPEFIRTRGVPKEMGDAIMNLTKNRAGYMIWTTLLHPESSGEVLLKSNNPRDYPLIYPNYVDKDIDMQIMLEGIRFAEKIVESEAFKKINPTFTAIPIPRCDEFEFRSDDYWRCAVESLGSTMYHPVGTCKMGPGNDPGAVVDSRLKVHGIETLRVVDCSVMPTITSGNTNAPALMIGQKGATMVLEDNTKKNQYIDLPT